MLQNHAWWLYFCKNKENIRDVVIENVLKVLLCGLSVCGYKELECSNEECSHTKIITFSCNSRFCSTCGKRATDQWINKQLTVLPNCSFQHITFTMPSSLWSFFAIDSTLLNEVAKLAAECIQILANKRGITVGIFTALHTFGHDLKHNVHIHLSVTMGGLTKNKKWKKLKFSRLALMPMWRYRIISLLRKSAKKGLINIDPKLLENEYNKHWQVHLAKETKSPEQSISYLGSYIKRPPISMAKIKHYDGKEVTFRYMDRQDNKYKDKTYDIDTFIEKFTQHIPEKYFRLIRYYGFLANRVRSKLLPLVQKIFGTIKAKMDTVNHKEMHIKSFGINPYQCPLCNSEMLCVGINIGQPKHKLMKRHAEIAHSRILLVAA